MLKDRVREIRPEYRGVDPVDRLVHEPGQRAQCDLWFPDRLIPIGHAQAVMLPVLVMTLAYSRFITATMIPTRAGGDILAGMWRLISGLGAVTKQLWWDRESAIGGSGKVTGPAAAFAGTLGTSIVLARPRDPEFKGMVERHNGYLETSFLPGRVFTGPEDFNAQLADWLPVANTRVVRSLGAGGARPLDHLPIDLAAMTGLPPMRPGTAAGVGLSRRVRLGREYYVRLDTCDYSVHPSVIGRFVDVHADLDQVTVTCEGSVVARHARCWARRATLTDPAHVEAAARLRAAWQNTQREAEQTARAARAARPDARRHPDGHRVQLRALPDYDALFGVEFQPTAPTATTGTTGSGVTR